jgi:V/A-type H+-transporting ATPase subunit I
MMSAEKMKRIEILLLEKDTDEVLRYLGFAGCMQLIADSHAGREPTPEERALSELRIKVETAAHFLGIAPVGGIHSKKLSRSRLIAESERFLEGLRQSMDEEARLLALKLKLSQAEDELLAFKDLDIPFEGLSNLHFLVFRVGEMPQENLENLRGVLKRRALIVSLGRPGFILAVAPKKSRWALDSELKRAGFQETRLPAAKGAPPDLLRSIRRDREEADRELEALEKGKAGLKIRFAPLIKELLFNLDLVASIDAAKQGLAGVGTVKRITGWIPRRKFTGVAEALESLTKGRIAMRAFDPEEIPEVREGRTKVPVMLRHGPIIGSFQRMVFSYSIPLYGTIDPTPFVAAIFVLLFAIMFGDAGQAMVGIAFGILINSGKVPALETWRRKRFGNVFVVVGIASMITGFLYGSFFANEEVLVPLTRFVTRLIVGHPLDRIIVLQGISRIIVFFGFTIGVGALINSVGLVFNLVNQIRLKNWDKALLSKTGLAGALFFWYVIFVGVRILLGGRFMGVDLLGLALPLVVLFFREPLSHLLNGTRPLLKEGLFVSVIEGIMEMLESVIYYMSNSVSFLRVAAFAMAHAVLSFVVFSIGDLVSAASGGIVFKSLVVVLGNSIIILLEGLVVSIQVIRLQYYEFFSKFFTESGEEFQPFILRASGGLS